MSLINRARAATARIIAGNTGAGFIDTLPETTRTIVQRAGQFSMTSPERLTAVVDAMHYVDARGIPGAFVECGVWKGGSAMAAMLASKKDRDFYLYDTYEGMSEPTAADVSIDGNAAADLLASANKSELVWARSGVDEVRENIASTGYPPHRIHFVQGKVEDTIPETIPDEIAILRLDTDWYESTAHELEHLYPRLAVGGVLIIDDYGHWQGARRAVDEYFAGDKAILLHRLDYTGRMTLKV
jgi:hypothetical protein